jgi:hypothetical protein
VGGWQWNPPLKMNGFAYDLKMEGRMVGWCRYCCVFNVFFTECAVGWTLVLIVWRMIGIEGCFGFIREIVVFYKGKCSLNCVENGREM